MPGMGFWHREEKAGAKTKRTDGGDGAEQQGRWRGLSEEAGPTVGKTGRRRRGLRGEAGPTVGKNGRRRRAGGAVSKRTEPQCWKVPTTQL